MLATVFLLLAANAACSAQSEQIAIEVTPVSGEALGGRPDPAVPSFYRVGDFIYQGYGIVERSSAPAFRDLVLDQEFGLRHLCGNGAFGPSGWNARDPDLDKWTLKIEQNSGAREPAPGAIAAERQGASPIVRGYISGATWPISLGKTTFFLGLMHPANGSANTLIVAFAATARPTPALVMADIPMNLETISIVPDLHGPDSFVNLAVLKDDRLTQIVLKLDRETSQAIGAKLSNAPR